MFMLKVMLLLTVGETSKVKIAEEACFGDNIVLSRFQKQVM
jgi:hypothetical protein